MKIGKEEDAPFAKELKTVGNFPHLQLFIITRGRDMGKRRVYGRASDGA